MGQITYTDESLNLGGNLPKPAFSYNPNFSFNNGSGTTTVGQAVVLEDEADFPSGCDYDYNDDYFKINVQQVPGTQSPCPECEAAAISNSTGAGVDASGLTAGGSQTGGNTTYQSSSAPTLATTNGGIQFGVNTIVSNNAVAADGSNGHGVSNGMIAKLDQVDGNTIEVVDGAVDLWFDLIGSTYQEHFGGTDTLTYNSGSDTYTLIDSTSGNVLTFNGFSSSLMAKRGAWVSTTAPGGGELSVISTNSIGQTTEIQSTSTTGGVTTTDTYTYTYITGSDPNAGLLSNITLQEQVGSASPVTVQQVAYTYYDGSSYTSFGNVGDSARPGRRWQRQRDRHDLLPPSTRRTVPSVSPTAMEYMFLNNSYNRLLAAEGS